MSAKVSVIIPNYNNVDWLEPCIDSCLNQGDLLEEIIVVDDHSTDGSLDLLKKFEAENSGLIRVLLNPEKGANHARNYGFAQSKGDYIQWLDSDDLIYPDKWRTQIKALSEINADIAYSDWRIIYYQDGKIVREEDRFYKKYDDFLYQLLIDNWTSPNNYLLTRRFADRLKDGLGWNPETRIGQDREYFTMAGLLGANFVYVPGIFALYNKQEKGTISGMDFKERLERNQTLEYRFRNVISESKRIPDKIKGQYLKVLNTHLLKACFYHPGIKLTEPISFFGIQWKLMHWKMRLIMPLIYLFKHTELIFNIKIKPVKFS